MSPTERTQITYRQERWRCVCAGLLETAGNTFLLLLAVRHFQAGSMAKALIKGSEGTGEMFLLFGTKFPSFGPRRRGSFPQGPLPQPCLRPPAQ